MKKPVFERCPKNPIVIPGGPWWRKATVFNPAVVLDDDGTFYMIERAAGSLRPHACFFGLQTSRNGIDFELASNDPVFTPAQAGFPHGSVQDPRVVKIGETFYMVYAVRPYAGCSLPVGFAPGGGLTIDYPAWLADPSETNATRSAIATSPDCRAWTYLCETTERGLDDRDNILFPEKIGGRFALIRRPMEWTGPGYGMTGPGMWLSYSDDLKTWSQSAPIAGPEYAWEDGKIGGSTPPLRTERGWLTLYHGVESLKGRPREKVYRVGAMLLDLENPAKVLARTPEPIMEPETYYEKVGLVIPNVVFPCGNVIKDGLLYVYYGCCDTSIAVATVEVAALLKHLEGCPA